MMPWFYRVILLIGLIWGHRMAARSTLFVGMASPQGIPPVTQTSVPLSADDVARGLLAHPPGHLDRHRLQMAHEARYILSQQQHELRMLRHNQQQQAIQLLQLLETP
jgi:hypothetical protein